MAIRHHYDLEVDPGFYGRHHVAPKLIVYA
jgi:hypothetical protein